MASNTSHLGLLKKDVATDGNDTFNIETMLNQNWEKIDSGVKAVDDKVKNIDFSSLSSKADLSAHTSVTATTATKGHVQLSSAVSASESVAITPKGVNDALQIINATVATKADKSTVDASLLKKADQSAVISSLATKADQTSVDAVNKTLATKADQTVVDTISGTLAKKAEQTAVDAINTALAKKAEQTIVNESNGRISTLEGLSLQIQNGGRLGDFCQSIADWNAVRKNGFYMGVSAANAPTGDWFFGQVTAHNEAWCEQRVIAFSSSKHEYKRYMNEGVWSGWQRVTPGNLDTLQFGTKTDIATSMNELFQYADSGKTLVRNAVIGKGVSVVANPTFQQLANSVNNIVVSPFADVGWIKGTNEWYTSLAPRPTAAESSGSVSHGGKMYVLCGNAAYSATALFSRYDPKTDVWTTLPNPPIKYYDAKTNLALVGDYIHVVGGRTSSSTSINSHYRYSISGNSWSTMAVLPAPRYGNGVTNHSGLIYSIGGYYQNTSFAQVYVYNPSSNTWSASTPFSETASDILAFSYGSYLYAHYWTGIYKFSNSTWVKITTVPRTARYSPASVVYGSKFYVIGGSTGTTSNFVDIFDLNTLTWSVGANALNEFWYTRSTAQVVDKRIYALSYTETNCYLP